MSLRQSYRAFILLMLCLWKLWKSIQYSSITQYSVLFSSQKVWKRENCSLTHKLNGQLIARELVTVKRSSRVPNRGELKGLFAPSPNSSAAEQPVQPDCINVGANSSAWRGDEAKLKVTWLKPVATCNWSHCWLLLLEKRPLTLQYSDRLTHSCMIAKNKAALRCTFIMQRYFCFGGEADEFLVKGNQKFTAFTGAHKEQGIYCLYGLITRNGK